MDKMEEITISDDEKNKLSGVRKALPWGVNYVVVNNGIEYRCPNDHDIIYGTLWNMEVSYTEMKHGICYIYISDGKEPSKKMIFRKENGLMTKSEYIIWKCETLEQIKEEHPEWTEGQVQRHFSAVKAILENRGFFN